MTVTATPQRFEAPVEIWGKGSWFKYPCNTTTERDAITNLMEGQAIYNETTKQVEIYNGAAWKAPSRVFDRTILATEDHSSGITEMSAVFDDYGTLIAGQTYKAFYARYNVRSTAPGNPVATVVGVHGAVACYIAEEALTFRGGYFTTYVDAGTTASMRTNIGCEVSPRASYSGGTECVAEVGTAFVGMRIWMAPYFTDASISNINNFHGLWILNEATGKVITHAIKIDASTYQGGFNYALHSDDGKIRATLDGTTGSSFAAGGSVTTAGDTLLHIVGDDYRTLTAAQEYKGAYIRYNVRSTTPGNPVCEVTGVHGAVGSYIAEEAISFRGGYFTTYTAAGTTATMRTAVGCEASARASYSGGAECVAEVGTAFVGIRIWMAPYFTDASIPNINNSHALWILNETPNGGSWGKYIENAIKIDATIYNSGFNYCFNTDSGKFRMQLDGSEAGSGLVAGERSTASGDDWMYVRAEDYRTLTSAQEYRAAYIRYNVRETAGGAAQCSVTGVEGCVGVYVADTNLRSIFGGHFRFYINADATSSTKTGIGCEISARAGYAGGTACEALAGTCFTGARIYMAPYFTSGSVGNINNFWGLWIHGEHTTQRNADAGIFINDAGGGYVDGFRLSATLTGYGVDMNGSTITTASMRLNNGMLIDNDKADRIMVGARLGFCNDASPADNAPTNGAIFYFDGTNLMAVNSTGATAQLNNAAFS